MKQIKRRILAAILCMAMLITMIPTQGLQVKAEGLADLDERVIAQFNFDNDTTGFTGGGAKATNHGVIITDDAVEGNAAYFDNKSYLSVTKEDDSSLLTGKTAITLSYMRKSEAGGTGWTFYAAPNANAQSYPNEHYVGVLDKDTAITVERYNNAGSRPPVASTTGEYGSWQLVTIVFDETETTVYVNGENKAVQKDAYKLVDILKDNSILYFGRANWGNGEYYKGVIDNFTIYDGTLTQEEIAMIYADAKKALDVKAQKDVINGAKALLVKTILNKNADVDSVASDLYFPEQINTVDMTYTVDNTEIISEEGKILYTGEEPKTVIINAVGRIDGVKVIDENITLKVTGPIVADKKLLDLENKDCVKGNLYLPTAGKNGSEITWTSSNPDVISDKVKKNEGYHDTPAGVVTRQAADTVVKLTATLKYGEETATKEFDVTVKAAVEQETTTDYLFAYFTGNTVEGENIYFAASQDGLYWEEINDKKMILTSRFGEMGLRDPFIIRSKEGDKFYLIATDLSIGRNGDWGRATNAGSQAIMVWESDDLVTWAEDPRMVTVSDTIEAGCTWAPEAYYDEITGEYVVFWASKTKGDNFALHRIYYSKTRDFKNFTEPEVWIDRKTAQTIDTTIVAGSDGYLYRISKNEGDAKLPDGTKVSGATVYMEKSKSLFGEWTKVNAPTLESIAGVEGPTCYKLNDDDADKDTWCLLLDHYGNGGFRPYLTNDLNSTTDEVVFELPSDYSLPSSPRHGTVLPVTRAEFDRLTQKWGKIRLDDDTIPSYVVANTEYTLPEKVKVSYGGTPFEADVTWTVEEDTFKTPGKVNVKGKLTGYGDAEVEVKITVVSDKYIYFINSGNADSKMVKEIKAQLPTLRNEKADQLYTKGSWGFVDGNGEVASVRESTKDDIYSNGWWAKAGKDLEYIIPLEKGTYSLTGYFAEWWNTNRPMTFHAEYVDDEGKTVISPVNMVSVSGSNKNTTSELTLSVDGVADKTDVHVIVARNSSNDSVISGLTVEKISSEATPVPTPEDKSDKLLAAYSLKEAVLETAADGTVIADESGNNNDAVINGNNASFEDGALALPGGAAGSSAAYVSLPGSMFVGKDTLTISLWIKNKTGSANTAAMSFGTPTKVFGNGTDGNPESYWLLNPANPNGYFKSVWTDGKNAGAPWGTETATSSYRTGADWAMYTTVITPTEIRGYYNGELVSTASKSRTTTDFGENLVAAIGRSGYNDMFFKGGVSDVVIYEDELTSAEIMNEYCATAVEKAAVAVKLSEVSELTSDIELPTVGMYGTKITWSSTNSEIISATGKVTRPNEDKVFPVTLTATVSLFGKSLTRDFSASVLGASEETLFNEAVEAYELGIVKTDKDIVLPTTLGLDKLTVSWTSSNTAVITNDGKVKRPESGSDDVQATLKAVFTYEGDKKLTATKEFKVTVLAKEYGCVLAYTNNNESTSLGNSLHLAYSIDGATYTALNANTGICFANNKGGSKNVNPNSLGSLYIFRKADGTFGLLAKNATTSGKYIYVYDSVDCINFTNERRLAVTADVAEVLGCSYVNGEYQVFWKNGGKIYATKTADLVKAGETAKVEECTAERNTVAADAELPSGAVAANVLALSKNEYRAIVDKLGVVKNTGIKNVYVNVTEGETVELPEKVTAEYSDGSTTDMNVTWDVSGIDFTKAGTYSVSGTIKQTQYANPLIEQRADPCILLGDDGYYYFTASYPMVGGGDKDGYDKVVLRKSATIEGLAEAEEITIWDCDDSSNEYRYVWAPEIHCIEGTYYVFYTSSVEKGNVWGIRPHVLKCNNSEDIMNPASWEAMGVMQAVEGDSMAFSGFSLDMTIFENNGHYYVMWAQTDGFSSIFIAEVDKNEPWKCISQSAKISVPEYSWERVNENVDEGPNVIKRNGKLFCTFSAAGTGVEYCIGLLTADEDADLLNPESWVKQAYPILTSSDVEGEYGPGHNSFTVDEDGNDIFVYHARGQKCYDKECDWAKDGSLYDPCRDARVKRVHWAADGTPILKMTYEQELLTTAVTATVAVAESGEDEEQEEQEVVLKDNKITVERDVFIKSLSSKAFKLNAKANGAPLSYVSANKKVAKVDKNGKVTVVGTGVTTITITAAETKEYKAATKTVEVRVAPKKATIKSLKASKTSIAATWKKLTGASGYQIQISTSKKYAKKKTLTYWASSKKLNVKFKKLKKGTKYYVRVRGYKTIKVNGKSTKLYGSWSNVKSSKTKKK